MTLSEPAKHLVVVEHKMVCYIIVFVIGVLVGIASTIVLAVIVYGDR
jgi:hypothetical protein